MIVIAGDSWGCGEWLDCNNTHPGLAYYLEQAGYNVLNASIPAGSNIAALDSLRTILKTVTAVKKLHEITHIFLFQTDWTRDFQIALNNDINMLLANRPISWYAIRDFKSEFITNWINDLYSKLSKLAQDYNVKIGIIGGCSDAINTKLPGLYVACQSLTNLIVNDSDQIAQPVFSADATLAEFITDIKTAHPTVSIEYLTKLLEQANTRRETWDAHSDIWIDRVHPNRQGHYKLYEFLKETIKV